MPLKADDIQLRAAREGAEIREEPFQRRHEGRKQRAGVYGVERKAPAEHREAQRDERSVQNERDERHGQIHHAVYDYRRAGARPAAHLTHPHYMNYFNI